MLTIDESLFPKNRRYVIGVSGGPDSMCLLFSLISQGYELIACNVNYNTREESNMEQEMVIEFCNRHNVQVETISVSHSLADHNFEGWAREVRYSFFCRTYKKYKAEGLFIAHHKNDDIETYILQKNRNNLVKYWGLAPVTKILGMNVYRPFLDYEKKQLVKICEENDIPYSIDTTNLKPICERNKVRLDLLTKYNKEEIDSLIISKKKDNEKLQKLMNDLLPLLKKSEWDIEEISTLSEIEKIRFLYGIITNKCPSLSNKMSRRRIEEYLKALFSMKVNVDIDINEQIKISKSFGKFTILDKNRITKYSYIIEKPGKIDTMFFSCDIPEDTDFLKIFSDSYPLTIRNVKMDDIVTFGNVKKRMNRIMIDEKIPLYKRNTYPIVVDKNQKVVYFPLYKSDKQKNIANKLKFMIK